MQAKNSGIRDKGIYSVQTSKQNEHQHICINSVYPQVYQSDTMVLDEFYLCSGFITHLRNLGTQYF